MRRALVLVAACSAPAPRSNAAPDPDAASRAIFADIAAVLTHPRCVNCHPQDDLPRQGELHALHDPPVVRGPEDRGIAALRCVTCHQDANAQLARIPGAPDWRLAPREMAWLGKTPAEICAQLVDPARNGHRTLAQVEDHLAHDPLVGWGWAPGADRAPVPGTQVELGARFHAWIESGARCP